MTRKDLIAVGIVGAAILALLAPVWSRAASFFNHGDLYAYHWPLRHHTAEALIQGRFPFWNPYVLLGVPHAANPQAVLFYPPALLESMFPVATALSWDQVLHFLWAALGAFLLARFGGASRAAAAALSAAYALCPFLVYRVTAGIPTLLAALSWAPWAWLAWLAGRTGLLAAIWALQLFSGHPQFLAINAAGMAIWAAFDSRRAELWRRWAAGAAAALALGAVQWIATLEFLRGSNRSGWPPEFASSYSLRPSALAMWLWPGALSTPLEGGWPDATSVFYESGGVWLGSAMLLLACWGAARGRARLGAVVLAALGLLLALGANGPFGPLLSRPGFSYLRTPARWAFLTVWGQWLLAGAGLAALAARLKPLLPAFVIMALLELAVWDCAFLRPQDPRPFTAPNAAVAAALAGRPMRVLTDPDLSNPNKTIVYRMRNVNGYDAFYPASAARWAAEAEGAPAADSSRVLVSRWRSRAARMAGVAARLSASGVEGAPDAWPLASFIDGRGARVRPDPALSIETPERWRVSGSVPPGAAAVALAESRWPGWTAVMNGRPAPLTPWGPAFQAVPVPEPGGRIELSLEFKPAGWAWWAALSAAAWLAGAAGVARRLS